MTYIGKNYQTRGRKRFPRANIIPHSKDPIYHQICIKLLPNIANVPPDSFGAYQLRIQCTLLNDFLEYIAHENQFNVIG